MFKYGLSLKTKTFKFPGKSQNPDSFAISPFPLYLSLNKGSTKLYSTFCTTEDPSFLFILQIAPMASFGLLGTTIEFIS